MDHQLTISKSRSIVLGLVVAFVFLAWGVCAALLPPFFPLEAKQKGASISQSGSVFGIYGLSAFLTSPLIAKYGSKMNPAYVYIPGSAIQAVCTLLFGVLAYIEHLWLFLTMAHILRMFMGMAIAGAWGSLLAVLLVLFPNSTSKIVAATELFYGVGYMLGPAFGGVLYNFGGFQFPFVTIGLMAILFSLMLGYITPNVNCPLEQEKDRIPSSNMALIKTGGVMLPFLDTFSSTFSLSMVEATLGMNIRSIGGPQYTVNIVFFVCGGSYMLGNIFAACIADRLRYTSILSMIGNVGLVAAFTFIGPLPFIRMQNSLCILLLSIFGFGFFLSLSYVASYKRAKDSAICNGFPRDTKTYHQLSGLWVSVGYMGHSFGPIIGGFVVEVCGFRYATLVWTIFHTILFTVDLCEFCYNIYHPRFIKKTAYTRIHE